MRPISFIAIVVALCISAHALPLLAGERQGDFHLTLHHQVIDHVADDTETRLGCIRLNRGFAKSRYIASLPICFGPRLRGDTSTAFHISIGSSVQRELVGSRTDAWWRHVGVGILGGVRFISELNIGFEISGDGNGEAGIESSTTTADIDEEEDTVTISGDTDLITGGGSFSGDATGNTRLRFGFGVHLGPYVQLGPFLFEGGIAYDYLHRNQLAGFMSAGIRLPRLRSSR